MAGKRGMDMKLYRNTGTFGTPVWLLISNCRDVNTSITNGEANASTRANEIEMFEPTQTGVAFDWDMIYDPADVSMVALEAAVLAKTLVEIALADGLIATTGTRYRRWETKMFDGGQAEPMGDMAAKKFAAKPCYTTNAQGALTVVV